MTNLPSHTEDTDTGPFAESGGRRWIDPETEPLCVNVVDVAAETRGVDQSDMAILADFIDPIALDDLFRVPSSFPTEQVEGRVQFAYDDVVVTVTSDGQIRADRGALEDIGHSTTASTSGTRGPTTKAEFEDRLGARFSDAAANGIDIEGSYTLRTDDEANWAVELFSVDRP